MVARAHVVPFLRFLARYRALEFHLTMLYSIYRTLSVDLQREIRAYITQKQIEKRRLRHQLNRLLRMINITENDLSLYNV